MKTLKALILGASLILPSALSANEPVTLDALLEHIKKGSIEDQTQHKNRLAEFRKDRAEQQQQLKTLQQEKTQLDSISKDYEQQYEKNSQQLDELNEALSLKLGSMKELFGVLQQTANESRSQLSASITQVQYPERDVFLENFSERMGKATRLPDLQDIERLWFELQQEMTESGKVVRFQAQVTDTSGETQLTDVTRVGLFNVVSSEKYLQYIAETGRLVELPRQPQSRYLNAIADLNTLINNADSTTPTTFSLDPTRGQLLSMLVNVPNLKERIEQGGIVGYVILALGFLALLVTLERLISLGLTGSSIRKQIKQPDTAGNNPLGRILASYEKNRSADPETLELKIGKALMKEVPAIQKRLTILKVIAVISPLLGLLGTVTGMIVTFQALTLFGTGDPRLMAGGISQALVTTVLGLAVAIPTMLLHSLVSSKAKVLSQILEEQAVGIIAEQAGKVQTVAEPKAKSSQTVNKPAEAMA
ncbi:MotA/TolQ/ExbB proton channel family protein [Endozoicomonas arenosclerae]|uniref:MotA/TolQ/ExbB proton channel family protein n=1 Tax=Endozoicomonas arenosclerae TaxID=1633495 RepID=UPI00078296AA|nr:MotA/TolQ/ExbB proton channel family protein [Endozoicomonas arenosclerae]